MSDIKYIIQQIGLLSEYDLEKIETTIRAVEVSNATGVYVRPNGEISIPKMRVDLSKPSALLTTEIFSAINAKYSDTDFFAYANLGSIVRNYHLRYDDGNRYLMPSSYHLSHLLAFLDYIVSGNIAKDHEKVNAFLEKNPELRMNPSIYEFDYEGVRLKHFKNGRLDVKFKSPEAAERMHKLVTTWSKYRD